MTEVLGFHARLRPVPAADRGGEVRRVLARAGLTDRGPDRVGNLSKGLQQRFVFLAVALLGKPRLLLLDEPTSALDPTGERTSGPSSEGMPRKRNDRPAPLRTC